MDSFDIQEGGVVWQGVVSFPELRFPVSKVTVGASFASSICFFVNPNEKVRETQKIGRKCLTVSVVGADCGLKVYVYHLLSFLLAFDLLVFKNEAPARSLK